MKKIILSILMVTISACSNESWRCVEDGDVMYSMSSGGAFGAADKGCSCDRMADFERRKFGEVDYAGLNSDHGCAF